MIRRFVLASGDNNAINLSVTINPSASSGSQFFETGTPVSWVGIGGVAAAEDIKVTPSGKYPDLETGFELSFEDATPATPFDVELVYR